MKKSILIALTTIFALTVFGTLCSAQLDRTVTNTSKKGSLLIWPLIQAGTTNTTIQLSNNYYQSVKMKCAYRRPFPPRHQYWTFTLMPNQSIAWLASTGKGPDGVRLPTTGNVPPPLPSGTVAELSCWAVAPNGTQQIAWNWLAGDAIIGKGAQRWEYSAWRFAVNSSTNGAAAGTPGTILLTGDSGNYDACPTALLFNILRQTPDISPAPGETFPPGTVSSRLTLVPCHQDVRDNGNTVAYTKLLTKAETGGTQGPASVCVGSGNSATQWFSESLSSPKLDLVNGANPFVKLRTPGGSILVHGMQNAGCTNSIGVPLLGVMSMQFSSGNGPSASVAPTAVGPGQAYIKDADDNNTPDPITIRW